MDQAFKSDTWKWLWLKWEGRGWKESKRWGGFTVATTLCNFPYKYINYHVKSAEIFAPAVLLLTTREQRDGCTQPGGIRELPSPRSHPCPCPIWCRQAMGMGQTDVQPTHSVLPASKHKAFCTRRRDFAFHTHMGFCLAWIHSFVWNHVKAHHSYSHMEMVGFFWLKGTLFKHLLSGPFHSTAFLEKIGKALLCRHQRLAFKASRHDFYIYKPKGKSKTNPRGI